MAFNPERHHRRSIRLKGYNYAQAGAYFITLCTEQRECLFGEVVNDQMRQNGWGEIVCQAWEQIAVHWPMVELDSFIVMPNHVHGIVVITEGIDYSESKENESGTERDGMEEKKDGIEKGGIEKGGIEKGGGTPPLQKPTLGAILAFWKYQSSKSINGLRGTPGVRLWQRNYYERIIRNEIMLDKARAYIANNPARWVDDVNHPMNLA